ncbi:BglG family transcription antiterminator [Rossellomorea vietnamensis]|uniref:BglG family transcription antiterminator n=1 Tax=Rossellomorea vietnamensis TaxID=218284 RepID=A0A5D4K8Y0_9BACI|nr:transcription antiterminator [Rossellomorea vietnamensis]TYR73319.1 BglG family transcription antiterminator [Rossellomorea vietnamensis]
MFITSREKSIIDLIIRTSGKHTVSTLSDYLHVSGRTIQRNLKSVEKILNEHDLELKRTTNEGLFIDGRNEQIFRLIQKLTDIVPTDETPLERKLHLLITLLDEGPYFKKQVLANQLGISTATLTVYLDELALWLSKFSVNLTRKRGVGVEVAATEANKRHALANFFLVHFYENIIESLYLIQKGQHLNDTVLGYFSPEYLLLADQAVNPVLDKAQSKLTDSDYTGLIVYICLTIQRIQSGFLLEEMDITETRYDNEYRKMNRICDELIQTLSVPISSSDVHFLSVVLKGSKVQAADSIDYDSILLGQHIKNLIHDVSSKLNIDLSDDFSLYQGLIAHMEPSIFRLKQEMELFNPLTDEIKKKYPVLFLAVKNSLENRFKDIYFPEAEVAFVVLHFGSALVMNEEKVRINAVVVCPTGIGTSKMLASRIQKEIAEINSVEILSLTDFQSADMRDYDIVISTVRLPFTDIDYILVNPLLSEKDIEFIHNYLQNNLEKLTRNDKYLKQFAREKERDQDERPKVRSLLQEIKEIHSSIESILDNYRFYRMEHTGSHFTVLGDMVTQAEKDGLLHNTDKVMHELRERERKGGLGIPNTNMGLFHCRSKGIQQLIFQIAHLKEPCIITGMDGIEMPMKSVLLMLAPENLNNREQEVVSLISTSLIEDEKSMMIYSSANGEMIRRKLEDLFLDYLQNNLVKD